MIAKKYRVPKELIPRILKNGDSFKSQFFIVRKEENEVNYDRFRVIISRKVESKAVRRNKLRRQVYEAIRLKLKDTSQGTDFILIPKSHITKKSYTEIEEDIAKNIINNG